MTEEGSEDPTQRYITSRVWLLYLTGHGPLKPCLYKAYIAFIFSLLTYLLLSSLITICAFSVSKELVVKTIHVFMLLIFSFGVILCRVLVDESLNHTTALLNSGIYEYEGEARDDNVLKMKRNNQLIVRKRANTNALILILSGISNTFVYPLTMMFAPVEQDKEDNPFNPYLPHPFYTPFNTRTFLGYLGGFLLNLLFMICVYSLAICSNDIYTRCTGTLKVQLEILNYSLLNIKKRAYMMLEKGKIPSVADIPDEDLLGREDFQRCLQECLKSNIKHHLAIMRFRKSFHKYTGSVLLEVCTVAGGVVGTIISLLLQQPPLNSAINYVLTILAEFGYPLYLCYCGEDVLQESGKLFETLYVTPWIYCDERFKKMILMMMSNTRSPLKIKTVVFDLTASLETFGGVVSVMYKIVSLIRQQDRIAS